jgi:hypothetical protein
MNKMFAVLNASADRVEVIVTATYLTSCQVTVRSNRKFLTLWKKYGGGADEFRYKVKKSQVFDVSYDAAF